MIEKETFKILLAIISLFWISCATFEVKNVEKSYLNIFPSEIYNGDVIVVEIKNYKYNNEDKFLINYKNNKDFYIELPKNSNKVFVPIPLNSDTNVKISLIRNNIKLFEKELSIKKYISKVSKINVNNEYLFPPKKFLNRIAQEKATIKELINKFVNEYYFTGNISLPLDEGIITSNFGDIRILNGIKTNYHFGVDFAQNEGAKVKTILDGIIELTGDFYFEGKIICINHGMGIFSMYYHLGEIFVKKGDFVKAGDIIGSVGKTGRTTGPHLHLSLYINRIPVNPLSLFKIFQYNL